MKENEKKGKNKKIILFSVIGAVLLIGIISVLGFFFSGSGKTIAVVNGEKVTQGEFNKEIESYKTQASVTEVGDDVKSSIYETLINMAILKQEADRQGIVITDEDIEAKIAEIAEAMGTTVEDYENILSTQFGIKKKELQRIVSDNYLLQDKLYEKISEEEVPAVEADVKKAYDTDLLKYREVLTSHILFTVKSDSNAEGLEDGEALAKAKDIITKLEAGADFADLAKEYSMDGTAANGGALTEYASKVNSPYVEPFTDALLKLKVGEYTKEPVKTDYGYHVILATDEKSDFDSLRKSIENDLYGTQRAEKYQTYIEALINNAKIERKLTFNTETTQITAE